MCLRLLLAEDISRHTIDARRNVASRKVKGIDDLIGFERRWGFRARRRDFFRPRQRQHHNRRVDLVVDLLRDVRFDGRLIDSVGVAPVQHLLLGQIGVRREATTRRSERAGAVAGAAVAVLRAVATPVGGDDDIGEAAFDGLRQEAFDDPRDVHLLGELIVGHLLLVSSNAFSGPDGVGDFHNLLWLTGEVRSWSQTIPAIGRRLDRFTVEDLVRQANLQDSVWQSLAEREDGAFGEHGVRRSMFQKQ